ncbi:MAG TPA: hydrogenase maturation nickel metallochaperone HypA [Humidesulfovibrio sp.]|uniref:hydrogenase maturation nickel metallochaperone HypA n=1 Tax=Humidesulfovibrio sp. TaxID=2910988 RepID=UPI002C1342B7|nr:hydrogenase maturation nickel metallochaperone HypA [Humidesulfovibrio sp.]HWR04836.1 hydrogenase maturation nickel metallochaperone HypA [Humidesulfovibrio sp.]
MHESSMAMSILGIVTDEAHRARVGAVQSVCLCLGELAAVEATTLSACFEMLSEGTIADKAKLVIKRIPATGTCLLCEATVRRQDRRMRCHACGTGSIKLATGRELYVESIEVENSLQG